MGGRAVWGGGTCGIKCRGGGGAGGGGRDVRVSTFVLVELGKELGDVGGGVVDAGGGVRGVGAVVPRGGRRRGGLGGEAVG